MSGGSHNYLCYKEAIDLLHNTSDLKLMSRHLKEGGYKQLSRDTDAVLRRVEVINRQLTALDDGLVSDLFDVWKAVEWYHSCDTSEATMIDTLERKKNTMSKKPYHNPTDPINNTEHGSLDIKLGLPDGGRVMEPEKLLEDIEMAADIEAEMARMDPEALDG